MTLQSIGTQLFWPGIGSRHGAISVGNLVTLDAAGEYESLIVPASQAMTVSHVGLRSGTATGNPELDLRIETVDDTTGLPTGTLWDTNTNIATGVVASSLWNVYALTAAASIPAGSIFALKAALTAGTSLTLTEMTGSMLFGGFGAALPYRVRDIGTPTKSTLNQPWGMALGSSTTAWYLVPGIAPILSAAENSFNNTNAARRGLRFRLPFKARAIGARMPGGAATGDLNIAIFSDAGAELSSSSTAYDGSIVSANAARDRIYYFDSPVTLEADTWYRLVMIPSSATNVAESVVTLGSADVAGALMGGARGHYTTYVTDTWTDSATNMTPLLDVIIDQIDFSTGAAAVTRASAMIG